MDQLCLKPRISEGGFGSQCDVGGGQVLGRKADIPCQAYVGEGQQATFAKG
jgi:hypothetical protein